MTEYVALSFVKRKVSGKQFYGFSLKLATKTSPFSFGSRLVSDQTCQRTVPYSNGQFSFRENKTEEASISNLTKEKPNERKTEKAYFRAKAL